MLGQIALFYAVGRVGDIAGGFAQGCHHVADTFGLQGGGGGFKFYRKVCIISSKCGGGGSEVDTLVNGKICRRVNIVFLQDKFKDHLRHTAFSAAEHIGSFDIFPFEIVYRFP